MEQKGEWRVDTNRVGHPYEQVIEPQDSFIVSLMPPEDVSAWQSSFLVQTLDSSQARSAALKLKLQHQIANFHLQRLGLRGPLLEHVLPDSKPFVVTSEIVRPPDLAPGR